MWPPEPGRDDPRERDQDSCPRRWRQALKVQLHGNGVSPHDESAIAVEQPRSVADPGHGATQAPGDGTVECTAVPDREAESCAPRPGTGPRARPQPDRAP